MRESTVCKVCQRAIWVEDGPVCVFCREPEPEATEVEQPAVKKPVKAPVEPMAPVP